jgi:hypothetical protein
MKYFFFFRLTTLLKGLVQTSLKVLTQKQQHPWIFLVDVSSPAYRYDIVRYTNQYASWKQARTGPDTYWEDITEPEIRAFLSINILMGIHQLPQVEMYWSTNQYVGNQGIQKTMTCNRFIKIS